MPTNDLISTKKDLILSDDFEKALDKATDVRKSILTSVKSRSRDNFDRFYEIMLSGNRRIQEILDKKAKNRTDSEKQEVKEFKSNLKRSYKTVVEVLADSGANDDGQPSVAQKIIDKIASSIFLLKYLGNHDIQNELQKRGISISFASLEEQSEVFENENIRNGIEEIFENGKRLKDEVDSGKQEISETIYSSDIPEDLQYDKSVNPCGLKPTDFVRLVDMKTKLVMAREEEEKANMREKANGMAEEKEFEIARNRLVQAKLEEFTTEENPDGQ